MLTAPKGLLTYDLLKDKIFKGIIKSVTLCYPDLSGMLRGTQFNADLYLKQIH